MFHLALRSQSVQKRLSYLDFVRGFSFLWVLSFHWRFLPGLDAIRTPTYGQLGVDLFFVLSGYFIWGAVGNRGAFAIKRISRIYPALLSSLFLYWMATGIGDVNAYLRNALFFINPGSSSPSFGYTLLGPTYTLTYEVLFYLIVFLAWSERLKFSLIYILFVIGYSLLNGRSPLNASFSLGSGFSPLDVLLNPVMLLFFTGGILRALEEQVDRYPGLIFCGAVMVLCGYVNGVFPLSHGVSSGGGIAVAVILICRFLARFNVIDRFFRGLAPIGVVSYSGYLVHDIVPDGVRHLSGVKVGEPHYLVIFLTLFAVLLAVNYLIVEKFFSSRLQTIAHDFLEKRGDIHRRIA